MTDRYTRTALALIVLSLLGILATLWIHRPVLMSDFIALSEEDDREKREAKAKALMARLPAVQIQGGMVTVDEIQSTVQAQIEGGFVTVDGEVAIERR